MPSVLVGLLFRALLLYFLLVFSFTVDIGDFRCAGSMHTFFILETGSRSGQIKKGKVSCGLILQLLLAWSSRSHCFRHKTNKFHSWLRFQVQADLDCAEQEASQSRK